MGKLNKDGECNGFEQLSLELDLESDRSNPHWSQSCHDSPLSQHSFGVSPQDVPVQERPRERLLELGPSALSLSELLSLLLEARAGNLSALGLGQRILKTLSDRGMDPLSRLREVTVEELTTILGVGPVKAAAIVAAIELGRRVFQPKPESHTVIDDPEVAVAALSQDLMWQSQEHFAVVLLDIKNRLLGTQVVTIGTATETLAYPRDVFRIVMHRGATRIIIAHNHPTGVVAPSVEDLALTKQFLQSGIVLGIPVLDHLILGTGNYLSLRSTTNLWQEHPQDE